MLILLATGQTQADIDKVFLGRADSPFTPEGNEQTTDAAETLAPYDIDYIFSSDLIRGQETTSRIVDTGSHGDFILCEELRERSAGVYEGKKYSDIRKGMSPKVYRNWERDPFDPPLLGESLVDVRDRILPWWNAEIKPLLDDNKTVLLVSHNDTLRVLIAIARGDDLMDVLSTKLESGMPYFYHGPISKA